MSDEKPSGDEKPTFEEWLARLFEIMRPDMEGVPPESYCPPDDWRDYWEDGDTPEEAWQSEKSYWDNR